MSNKLEPDQGAAHQLLTEMRTRIALQPLPYQYGVEARALESLWELFGLAREAMKAHPGCENFARIATCMLNVHIRPVTAKWHRAHKAGVLDSRDGANEFRAELALLRKKLTEFAAQFQVMAYGTSQPDDEAPPVVSDGEIDACFKSMQYGVVPSDAQALADAEAINSSERGEIAARRRIYGIQRDERQDAVGLALSGGGIRSATFCLGVVQVLAERGLLKDVDYLSTVSGGGYVGSFITSRVDGAAGVGSLGQPFGPDTDEVRHLRQNAKYLAAKNFAGQWGMVASMVAGLLLNLSGPLALLCALALITAARFDANWFLIASQLCATASFALLFTYAVVLRYEAAARWIKRIFAFFLALSVGFLAGYWLSLAISTLGSMTWSPGVTAAGVVAMVIAPGIVVALMRLPSVSTTRKVISNALLFAVGLLFPILVLVAFCALLHLAVLPLDVSASFRNPLRYMSGHTTLLIALVVFALVAVVFVDVNHTGLHRLYRDRLAKTFIDAPGRDHLPLERVNERSRAPYHLINATINLSSSENRAFRDRRGDFFLMSKHWIGSRATGYRRTSEWKNGRTPLYLSTAMAVSGAAASPQMGLLSKPGLAPLLSLMNVRLNYWLKNPDYRCTSRPGFLCLLREMSGVAMSATSNWFNLSDGGHIENTGVYELLRRRCKFIICVDGEADPKFMFAGQMTLVRHAQIDLGIRLEPRLDEIRFNPESGVSRSHIHLLRVHYPARPGGHAAEIGLMLYLKLSVTGDEAELLKRYRMLYPEFPHQSTVNQFYDEEQFEAYRQLGVHVAEGAFSPALLTSGTHLTSVRDWFRDLAGNLLEPSHMK